MASLKPIPQDRLQAFWHAAPDGRLCPWEQAKALAFREASKEIHNGLVKLDWVASKLTKTGGGCPQKGSLSEFFAKVGAGPDWFPRKHKGAKTQPPAMPDSSQAEMHRAVPHVRKEAGGRALPGSCHPTVPQVYLEPGDGGAVL